MVDAHLPAESQAFKVALPTDHPASEGLIDLLNEPLPCTRAAAGQLWALVPWVRVMVTLLPAVKFAPVTVTGVTPASSTVVGDALIEAGGGGVGVGLGSGLGIGLAIGVGGWVGVGLGAG